MRAGARALAVIALASGTIAAAWWLARPRTDAAAAVSAPRASSDGAPSTASDAHLESADVLAAEPVVSAVPGDARSAIEPPPPAEAVAAESAPVATLRVLVRARETGPPLAGVRISIHQGGRISMRTVESPRGAFGESPITGPDGRAEVEIEADRSGELVAVLPQDQRIEREFAEVGPGASFDLVVDVMPPTDARLYGRLVDAETGVPVVGVVLRTGDGAGLEFFPTDGSGAFEVPVTTEADRWLKASADGYAWTIFPERGGNDEPESPLVLRMSRAATLEVTVRDSAGAGIAEAWVILSTSSYELQQGTTRLLDFSFDEFPDWRGRTGADGRATIDNLPPGVPLVFSIAAPHWPERTEADPISLDPGERRSLAMTLGCGATIAGRMVDANGVPISDRRVWRAAAAHSGPTLLDRSDEATEHSATDIHGRFEFVAVPRGTWWIGPAPEEDDIPPLAAVIEVASETSRFDVELRIDRGLYVRGQVVNPSGAPAPSCFVTGTVTDGILTVYGQANPAGQFALGPLPRDRYSIVASSVGDYASSEPVIVEAGSEGVVLALRTGGSVAGVVVDAGGGSLPCEVRLVSSRAAEFHTHFFFSDDGAFEFYGVAPGKYAVVACTKDGRIGTSTLIDVAEGRPIEDLRVEVSQGAWLELGYRGPARYLEAAIWANGVPVVATIVERGASPSVGVPAGTIELRWKHGATADELRTEKFDLKPGEQRSFTLRSGD